MVQRSKLFKDLEVAGETVSTLHTRLNFRDLFLHSSGLSKKYKYLSKGALITSNTEEEDVVVVITTTVAGF